MVVIKISNGLGNQMFQYAAAYNLSRKLNTDIHLDIGSFSNKNHDVYMLDNYMIPHKKTYSNFRKFIYYFQSIITHKFNVSINLIKTWNKLNNITVLEEKSAFEFEKDFDTLQGNVYLHGYFQNLKYFNNSINELKIIFSPKINSFSDQSLILLSNLGKNENSVSIHVRRGDYEKHGFRILNEEYYEESISIIKSKLTNPQFFVFGDGQEWFRKNINLTDPVTYVNHTTIQNSYEDIALMSTCMHNIISNSTFAWWGAFLNKNDGLIIAPKAWIFEKPNGEIEIFPSNWILI